MTALIALLALLVAPDLGGANPGQPLLAGILPPLRAEFHPKGSPLAPALECPCRLFLLAWQDGRSLVAAMEADLAKGPLGRLWAAVIHLFSALSSFAETLAHAVYRMAEAAIYRLEAIEAP